jgi:hypothetical protein
MKTVERSSYPGWNNYPVYCCTTTNNWYEVSSWCHESGVETFLLSSGSNGYTFQVRSLHPLFVLRWS